eukprot:4331512-Pleurochrysis_carterae.AAC.4
MGMTDRRASKLLSMAVTCRAMLVDLRQCRLHECMPRGRGCRAACRSPDRSDRIRAAAAQGAAERLPSPPHPTIRAEKAIRIFLG